MWLFRFVSGAGSVAPPEPAARAVDVYIAEFNALRAEIGYRTQISVTLVLAELTALGAGLSLIDKVHDVLLGLAAVSGFLWLLWLDASAPIHKIAAYVRLRLAEHLKDDAPGALRWESFYRQVDDGGKCAAAALRLPPEWPPKLKKILHTSVYMWILFLGTPILLVGIYAYNLGVEHYADPRVAVRLAAAALALSPALFGLRQSLRYKQLVDAVTVALRRSELERPCMSSCEDPHSDEVIPATEPSRRRSIIARKQAR